MRIEQLMIKIYIYTGIRANNSEAEEMFKEADVTGSGKVGFPEFMSMMARRMKQVLLFIFLDDVRQSNQSITQSI